MSTIRDWLNRQMSTIRDWLDRLVTRPKNIHFDPEYVQAHDFKERFSPKKDVSYEWVATYARDVYNKLDQADQVLDAKAETIIKLLGGGVGLFSLGAIVNISRLGLAVSMCLVVAILLAFIAIFVAVWVRLPRQTFMPPSVAWALEYADYYDDLAESKFLAQWHLACEGLRLQVLDKARGVKLSTQFAVLAFATVGISFLVSVGIMHTSHAPVLDGVSHMSTKSESRSNTSPAPDPAASAQTPQAKLQSAQNGQDPAKAAEPQSIQAADESRPSVSGRRK